MEENLFIVLLLIYLNVNISLSYKGNLYGIDQTLIRESSFIQIKNNSPNFDHLLNLGDVSISGPVTAMKTVNNENYIVTYHISDSKGVPHYFILTINIKDSPKITNNVTINGPGYGSFWQISDDEKQIFGIRESAHPSASLEVATIDHITGKVETVGLYPFGEYSLVMGFARQRRIYYNIIDSYTDSYLFCGINVDNGNLDINIKIPDDYLIYALIYDSIKDRLISIVYSSKVVQNSWFLATIIIDKNSSTMEFERIGNATIPMGENYLWSTTYTLALNERQWLTLWSNTDTEDDRTLIIFDIDDGHIVQKQIINHSKYLNNLVYFD